MNDDKKQTTDFVLIVALLVFIIIIGIVYLKVLLPAKEQLPELISTPIEVVDKVATAEEVEKNIPAPPTLTDEELIARVVMAEAEGEPFLVKVACAVCVLNRSDRSGETIETVLNSPNQFAHGKEPNEDCILAAGLARKYQPLFDSRMVYFRADYYHEKYGTPYFHCGNTYFSIEEG